jgi:hypothetical protein
METEIYKQNGYEDRGEYLISLADNYDISLSEVLAIADTLGENEDFDGLITYLDDYTS